MPSLFRRLQYWLRRRRFEANLEAELRFHREMAHERFRTRGDSTEDADRASGRSLGNTTLALEDARAVWVSRIADDLARDIRHAVRLIRRHPGFSALTVATLAIGIGAVTTVVSIVQAEVWRPLPFPSPDELVVVAAATPESPDRARSLTTSEFLAIRSQARLLSAVGGFRWNELRVVTGDPGAERVSVAPVSTNLREVLQVPLALGRGFRPEAERPAPRTSRSSATISSSAISRDAPTSCSRRWRSTTDRMRSSALHRAGLHLDFTSAPHLFVPIADLTPDGGDINPIARKRAGAAPKEIEHELRPILEPTLESTSRAQGRHLRVRDPGETWRPGTWRTYPVFMAAAGVRDQPAHPRDAGVDGAPPSSLTSTN